MTLATEEQQAHGEQLGAELRELIDRHIARYMPDGLNSETVAMNRACAALQALGLDAADNGGRRAFVEGAGFALGLMHEMFAEHGVLTIRQAMLRGFEDGRRQMRRASRPQGAA